MNHIETTCLNERLIEYFLSFPFPYTDILREQVTACSLSNRLYSDCYIILFERNNNVRQLPTWLPTVPQGCQILKESGPISCQLYIEEGYIAQFEVVDMGMNPIDWDYLWTHPPIFDVEYNTNLIYACLQAGMVKIKKTCIGQRYILFMADTPTGPHTVCIWDCDIRAFHVPHHEYCCYLDISCAKQDNQRFLLKSDDGNIDIECSLLGLQDRLTIG